MASDESVRFIVLMLGRTGSTLLVEALDSHSRVRAMGEAFKHLPKKSPERQIRRIRGFFTNPSGGVDALGFKLKHRDIGDEDALHDLLCEFDARVIHLQRRNRVKHVISFFNAVRLYEATDDWNLYSPGDRGGSFRMDPGHFSARLEVIEGESSALSNFVAGLGLPTVDIWYEELLTDRKQTLASAFEFLGVGPEPVDGATIKNTPDDLRHVLENFAELRSMYAGTRYAEMFDEVLVPAVGDDR